MRARIAFQACDADGWIGTFFGDSREDRPESQIVNYVVAHALMRAASRLLSTHLFPEIAAVAVRTQIVPSLAGTPSPVHIFCHQYLFRTMGRIPENRSRPDDTPSIGRRKIFLPDVNRRT